MVRARERCGEGERMAANRPRTDRVRIKTGELDPASETLDHDYFAFHKGAKKMPERQRQAIEAKFQAAFAERHDGVRRIINDYFEFWRLCGAKRCQRVSRCAGDSHTCFERWWPVTPERHKVYFRAAIKAINAGAASEQDVARAAQAEVERAAEHIARVEAQQLEEIMKRDAAMVEQRAEQAPHAARHPHPASGEREERAGPRVRAL
jgi:hypothetical protein